MVSVEKEIFPSFLKSPGFIDFFPKNGKVKNSVLVRML